MKQPVISVVDYEAWKRGYMPPSEHMLIDQLAYRGAKVNTMGDWGDTAFWIVTRGFSPTAEQSFKLHSLMAEIMLEEMQNKKTARTADETRSEAEQPDTDATRSYREVVK